MGAREEICDAMLDLVSAQGYEETSIEEILERAGVGRDEFDRNFSDKEDCAIAVFDRFMAGFDREVHDAYESESDWPDSLRAANYQVVHWITEHPREARFGAVDLLWAGELAQARREAAFQSYVGMAEAGREKAENPDSIPALTGEGLIGMVAGVVTRGMQQDDFDPYALVPEMMYLAVRPYLGEEAAQRELTIPPPARPPSTG